MIDQVVLVASDVLGIGSDDLGRILMRSFMKTLLADPARWPETMIFINAGVHLTCEGSELLPELRALSEQGVDVLSCGTCLDFFASKDNLKAGSVTNMAVIVNKLLSANSVVRL